MVDFRLNDEQTEYQKLAREVAQKQLAVNAHKYDIAAEPTVEPLHQIWESGLANVQIDSEQGGLGLGTWDAVVVAEELAAGCSGITAPLEASSLAILPVLKFGSAKQQEAHVRSLSLFGHRQVRAPPRGTAAIADPAGSRVVTSSSLPAGETS